MTRLRQRLETMIRASGPISVADYMAHCLFDPQDGYYTTREPFGRAGDFVTAPEISQMFGELIGVWIASAWEAIGSPRAVLVAEIGPGRGTLMKDIVRTLRQVAPALHASASVAMVETSPRLVGIQRRTLAASRMPVAWYESLDALPEMPAIIVGNEIFDAIPLRQFIRVGGAWRERAIDLGEDGRLRFVAGAGSLDATLLPKGADTAAEGAIVEIAPARSALMLTVAARIARLGGAGLFIDYGHLAPGIGDTLQAVRAHRHEDVLANPGEADLTAHVDFAALADAARAEGLDARMTTQGAFLLGLGLLERAGRLGAGASPQRQDEIRSDVERLAGTDAMGSLFKVLAVSSGAPDLPPFRA